MDGIPPSAEPVRRRRVLMLAAVTATVVGLTVGLVVLLSGAGAPLRLVPRAPVEGADPLAFDDGDTADLERAAAAGFDHVLYEKSPGGAVASAERTSRFRSLVEEAVMGSAFDADTLEAIVLLESAGRPDVVAGPDASAAAGLVQIVAGTATRFLGMRVNLAASRRLTRKIDAAVARGDRRTADRLQAQRRRVDARFDPQQALEAAVRYLTVARGRFGRDDLAVVSYHMGIGNLESVLRAYAQVPSGTPIREVVEQAGLSWARVYFGSSPAAHAGAYVRLTRLGDDSQTYYWRVLAAAGIMRLFRHDRERLERLADLQTRKASAEEVLHPPDETERFRSPSDLRRAWASGLLQELPDRPATLHLRVDPRMGEIARRLDEPPELYRGLRAPALALLLHLAQRVHELSRAQAPLTVTSTVRDDRYQQLLVSRNAEATASYSLHTTGYAFDVLRRYESPAQAGAFQYELERLQARNLIAWVREPDAIHVTVSSAAATLVPAMLRPS